MPWFRAKPVGFYKDLNPESYLYVILAQYIQWLTWPWPCWPGTLSSWLNGMSMCVHTSAYMRKCVYMVFETEMSLRTVPLLHPDKLLLFWLEACYLLLLTFSYISAQRHIKWASGSIPTVSSYHDSLKTKCTIDSCSTSISYDDDFCLLKANDIGTVMPFPTFSGCVSSVLLGFFIPQLWPLTLDFGGLFTTL